jgi:hypothetical protein
MINNLNTFGDEIEGLKISGKEVNEIGHSDLSEEPKSSSCRNAIINTVEGKYEILICEKDSSTQED